MKDGNAGGFGLRDVFEVEKLQEIQDAFTEATGFAAVFSDIEGNRITKPSGLCRACEEIVKGTKTGRKRCRRSDMSFNDHTDDVKIMKCLSAGLIDAVVWIKIFGKPIGKWSIGQVMEENEDIEALLDYADEIGVDREEYRKALEEVPRFSMKQIESTCNYMRISGRMLSEMAEVNLNNQIEIRKSARAEKELAESNEYYKLLFTSMLNGYAVHEMIYDEAGNPFDYRFIDVNPAFERLTDQKREDVIGKTILEIAPDIEKFWIERYGNVQTTGEPITFESFSAEMERYFEVHAFRPSEGRFATIFNDITEKMEAQEKIHQKHRLESIGTLAGGVAHEINNPINGIINYGQLILDSEECSIENKEYIIEMIRESERISSIVKNLLRFSRIEKVGGNLARVEDIIDTTVSLVRTISRNHSISIDVTVGKGLHPIKCMSNQIQQVLLNLMINSRDSLNRKYPTYHANKVIKVDCREIEIDGSDWMRITIEDRGMGIPRDIQAKVFEPFFTTKKKDEGTGLGLSISHGIIADHGGRLHFNSVEGKYTRFFIDLPIDEKCRL